MCNHSLYVYFKNRWRWRHFVTFLDLLSLIYYVLWDLYYDGNVIYPVWKPRVSDVQAKSGSTTCVKIFTIPWQFPKNTHFYFLFIVVSFIYIFKHIITKYSENISKSVRECLDRKATDRNFLDRFIYSVMQIIWRPNTFRIHVSFKYKQHVKRKTMYEPWVNTLFIANKTSEGRVYRQAFRIFK